MSFTRSRTVFLLLLLVVALFSSACAAQPAPEAVEIETGESLQATESDAITEEAGEAAEGEVGVAETRTIPHEQGTTDITGTPERVVALEWRYVEDLLALGIEPVGVADVEGYRQVSTIEPQLSDAVVDVGTRQEPNLEAIAALEPDLIIGANFRHEAVYDELSAIAPTLLYHYTDVPQDGPSQFEYMVQELEYIAEALNRQEAGEQVLTEMQARFDAATEQVAAAGLEGEPVVLAQFLDGAPELRLWNDTSLVAEALQKAGLENAWDGPWDRYGFNVVEYEALPEIAEANVFTIRPPGNPPENPYFEQLQETPLWEGLAFAQEDHFYELEGVWPFGGPLSVPQFTEQVVASLTGATGTAEEPTESTSETAGGPLSVTNALGEITLEEIPERIVALEWTYVEDLLALGVQPVGVADVEGYNSWVNVEPELAADVTDVGTRQEPSLEAIAALEPDLIVGVQFRHEPIYEDLSAIAPTLLFNPYPEEGEMDQLAEMEQTFLTIAEATGRTAEGEQVLQEMQATFDEAAETLAEADQIGAPFVLVQAFSSGEAPQLRLFTDNAMATRILQEIGLENAWEGEFDIYGFNTVGVEALTEVDPESHFFYVVQPNDDVFANQLAGNPVWEGLPFVQEERTHPLGGDTWLFGGPLSAELLVEKVVDALQ